MLEVLDLKKHFPIHGGILNREVGRVYAVDGVSFKLERGQTLGLVGESGCGKSTLGRAILKLHEPTSGRILFRGEDITSLTPAQMRPKRTQMQIIFQDPYSSLNPRMTVGDIVAEPYVIHGRGSRPEITAQVQKKLDLVGLPANSTKRYPHEFSGGQRQRIGIARALALDPELVVADEPVSALDVSIRSQLLNLMQDLKRELGLTYLFISHDLAVIEHVSDYIAVMYLGKIVEYSSRDLLYRDPQHPYTKALISAVPQPFKPAAGLAGRQVLKGDVPSPINPPPGCAFSPRCPLATDRCRSEAPLLRKVDGENRLVSCHYA